MAEEAKTLQGVFRFEAFELDIRAGELRRNGGKATRLPEQPFQILITLLEHPGQVVTREELRKRLWPNDTIVEFEHSISAAMNRLRQALGDSADNPHYVETLARRGYRWMVAVERIASNSKEQAAAGAVIEGELPGEGLLGKKVSHYRVLEILGGGGMGIVYRAEDVKLGRRVALKFLPEELATDSVALQRFEREAQAASALDHPNICTIYEFGEHEGKPFIVMQLLEGQTVREHIASSIFGKTWWSVERLLDLAIQIADGLGAAHRQGIIHRDIKPANIFITNRGEAKILDFGLAKLEVAASRVHPPRETELLEDRRTSILDTPIVSYAIDPNLTKAGERIGTACYMSPEQVRGERLDVRTDLFSLGLVLYEMATGQQAFSSNTAIVVHNAILHGNPPPVGDFNPELPPSLADIITKCIAKNRESRYQSTADLRADLNQLKRNTELGRISAAEQIPVGRTSKPTIRKQLIVATAIVAFVLGGLALWLTYPPSPPRVIGSLQITNDGRPKGKGWLVTDGARLYFVEKNAVSQGVIAQVSTAGGDTAPVLAPLENLFGVHDLSPSRSELLVTIGSTIGMNSDFQLWGIPVPAGAPHRVGDVLAQDACWAPDGTHFVYAHGSDLYLATPDGTNVRKLATVSGFPRALRYSPDGSRLRFTIQEKGDASSLWELSNDGKAPHPLLPWWNKPSQECCGTWSPDGKYYFFQTTTGKAQSIWVIPGARSVFHSDAPVQLTTGPLSFQTPLPSLDGKKLFVIGEQPRVELVRYDAKAKQFVPFPLGISAGDVEVSRDGQWIAYVAYPASTLWRSKIDGSERIQLTFPPVQAHLPRWSPDGTRIVFNDTQPGKPWKLLLVSSSGGATRDLLQISAGATDATWLPDGNSIVFTRGFGTSTTSIDQVDLTTNQTTKLPGSETLFSARVSRDGRYVAALSSDAKKLMLYDFAAKAWSELAQGGFGFENWSRDDRYIYALDDSQENQGESIVRVSIANRKLESLVNLKDIPRRTDLWAQWTGLATDDSPLVMRDRSTEEIYALDLQAP